MGCLVEEVDVCYSKNLLVLFFEFGAVNNLGHAAMMREG